MSSKIYPHDFIKKKKLGEKIVMITAYTYYDALLADKVGIDGLLVGDSLGMVIMGYSSTLPVTLDEIKHHLRAVANARPRALVVADMPFLSYEVSKNEAIRNAGELIKLGADAVKVEGGSEVSEIIEALTKVGIPVMGHIGLNPQRYLILGGYKLRGKNVEDALNIIESAKALQDAGVFSIVIEYTTWQVAAEVTRTTRVPTICIGSGVECDGQILVIHDLLGINPTPPPFVRKYTDLYNEILRALSKYAEDVRKSVFPGPNEFWGMSDEELKKFKERLETSKKD
ncbi:MAG: 3-methyl-2-oxobutanoate hydroxymethyltransferase [Desulfurococcaceae archaeon TW002]